MQVGILTLLFNKRESCPLLLIFCCLKGAREHKGFGFSQILSSSVKVASDAGPIGFAVATTRIASPRILQESHLECYERRT